jgi:hypothetical protein
VKLMVILVGFLQVFTLFFFHFFLLVSFLYTSCMLRVPYACFYDISLITYKKLKIK